MSRSAHRDSAEPSSRFRPISAKSWVVGVRRIGAALAPAALVIVVWWLTAEFITFVRAVPFPTPYTTFERLMDLLSGASLLDRSIYAHTLSSLSRWAIGFFTAATAGLLFGLVAGWWPLVERTAMPSVHVIQLVPGLAWIPVAILLFGIGEHATFFMIAVTAFAPIAINVVGGVKRVDENYVRAARMMGASGLTLFVRVLLPGALPQILSGLRTGLGNGWRVLVAAEMIVGTGAGLGYAIIQSRWTLDYPAAFVCIVVICIIGLLVERCLFAPLERRTVERWGLPRAV